MGYLYSKPRLKRFKDGTFIFPQIKSYLSRIMTFYSFLFPTITNYISKLMVTFIKLSALFK